MIYRRLVTTTFSMVLLALGLMACSASNTSSTAATTSPTALPAVSNLPAPITVGNVKDSLPIFTCGADAFASYYTLEVIQQLGIDVKHGFHLALVPFALDGTGGKYDLDESKRVTATANGQWDCLLTTLDSVALHGTSGQITALVDESAGADQLWAKPDIATLNDLRGHRIAVASDSVGEFFAYYTLSVAGVTIDPRTGATIVPANTVADAVKAFNDGKADAVSGWEPDILTATQGGARKLTGTDTLRVIVDVIVTSRQAINTHPDVVQNFHDAWFDALRLSSEDFNQYAQAVAAWGHNDWSGITTKSAPADLGTALDHIAQAPLEANRIAMENISIIQDRVDQAKRVWGAAGKTPDVVSTSVIEPKFVLVSAAKAALKTDKPVHNASFYMTARPSFTALTAQEADKAQTLAILPCRTFEFLPGDATLTKETGQILGECAVPILKSSPDIYLTLTGSAAWPTGATEKDTIDFAHKRAQAVADFLVSQGIAKERLVLKTTLPPPERRNLGDDREADRKKDRFVQLTLILTGR